MFQQHGFLVEECGYESGLAAVRPVSHWKCVVHYETQNMTMHKSPQMLEKNKSYIKQEWEGISLLKFQGVSSVPKRFLGFVNRNDDVTQWETCLCPNFFGTFCRSEHVYISKKTRITFSSLSKQ